MRQLTTNKPIEFKDFLSSLTDGNENSWHQFMSEFHGLLSSVAIRSSKEHAEDIIQEIYLEIIKDHFRLLRQFTADSRPAFLVYLRRIAENVARNYLRKQVRHNSQISEILAEFVDERPNPEAIMLADTDLQQFNEAVNGLRQDYQDVLKLLAKGFRHKEIALILDIPLATSLTRANRAVMILRKMLKTEINPRRENILL